MPSMFKTAGGRDIFGDGTIDICQFRLTGPIGPKDLVDRAWNESLVQLNWLQFSRFI